MNQLKLALRQLRLRPGLSFVVITMLALGIGATTAMFSLYHQILVRPLPVPEPERLVNLAAPGPGKIGGTLRRPRDRRPRSPVQLSDVPRARGSADRVHGSRGPHRFRVEPELPRAAELQPRRHDGVRRLLRRAEPAAGARKAHRARGRAAGRRVGRRRSRATTTGNAASAATRTCSASCSRSTARTSRSSAWRPRASRARSSACARTCSCRCRCAGRWSRRSASTTRATRFGSSTTGRTSSGGSSRALRSSRRTRSSTASTAAF